MSGASLLTNGTNRVIGLLCQKVSTDHQWGLQVLTVRWTASSKSRNFPHCRTTHSWCWRSMFLPLQTNVRGPAGCRLYLAAAEQGYPPAMCRVAACYRQGQGCLTDAGLARHWYRQVRGVTVQLHRVSLSLFGDFASAQRCLLTVTNLKRLGSPS